jgi:hypothetical protein
MSNPDEEQFFSDESTFKIKFKDSSRWRIVFDIRPILSPSALNIIIGGMLQPAALNTAVARVRHSPLGTQPICCLSLSAIIFLAFFAM